MSKTVINGIFLTQGINGVQRYGLEIVKALDELMSENARDIELVVPESYEGTYTPRNITLIKTGRREGKIWEQTDLVRYLKKTGAEVLCFENIVPLLYRKGTVVIHDISFKANPDFFSGSFKGKLSMAWRRLNYLAACRSGMHIVTVSEFSKGELCRYYNVDPARITVAGDSWQHIDSLGRDDSLFDKYPQLRNGNYYFAMATLAKWKNFKWVLNAAKAAPDETFVIAGGGNIEAFLKENEASELENVILPGYVTDEQAVSLMSGCRAFLFPTLYEGFGLPPLEAAAAGARAILVSDIDVMHEVYGDAASYLDPHDLHPDVRDIREMGEKRRESLLSRHSWEKSAEAILRIIRSHKTEA